MEEGMMRVLALILVISSLLATGCAELMEGSFNQREAEKVAAAVITGTLKPDAGGVVDLPDRWTSVSRRGRIYVTRKEDGLFLALFPTWRGKGSNLRGYLFSNRPLTDNDTIEGRYKEGSSRLEVMVPTVPAMNTARVSKLEYVSLVRKVKPGWYYVSYDMD
jgi:hypothetical protein